VSAVKLLEGKTGLVCGIANKRSIAWAIARSAHAAGAKLAVTYQNERTEDAVRSLAAEIACDAIVPLDVTVPAQLEGVAAAIAEKAGKIDFLVHCLAFADKNDLEGQFVDTSADGFRTALDVSAYSLVSLCRAMRPAISKNSSVLTLSYLGAERAVPHYNVMGVAKAALESAVRYLALDLGPEGVRVNAISAGAVNTLSARGIRDFSQMLDAVAQRAPLRRNVSQDEIGDAAVFLVSDLSRAITGEVIHVDCGYHCVGF
jgi:enoyl-[acyl-carrier protein] reductase I